MLGHDSRSGISRTVTGCRTKQSVCSGKNTFYLPFGELGQFPDWAYRTMRTIPLVKKLDCAFDMRDVAENSFALVQGLRAGNRLDAVGEDFERLSRNDRWELLHRANTFELMYVWVMKIDAFLALDLDLLRLDLSNCRCPIGCCRLWKELLENLAFDDTAERYPKRIEIVGAMKEEEDLWRATIRGCSEIPLERVFFVGATEPI